MKISQVVAACVLLLAGAACQAGAAVRVATFRCDLTPPLGARFYGGWDQPLTKLEDPLWAKGIVLEDQAARYVLCALDWCVVNNASHQEFRAAIAAAAGTDASRVALQCVHQHTAPCVDAAAERLLRQATGAPGHTDLEALQRLTQRLAAAVKESLAHLEAVDRLGLGEARVDRVAATRRVFAPDGTIRVRWSACKDPALRAEPEGPIDPMLKTVTFARGERPLVRLHYYATHPQTGRGDGWVGMDCVGYARERLERSERVPQIYFTGCAGDVTMGKYNDSSLEARAEITERLLAAMQASASATRFGPIGPIRWQVEPVTLPPRTDGNRDPAGCRATLADAKASPSARESAASHLAFHERIATSSR